MLGLEGEPVSRTFFSVAAGPRAKWTHLAELLNRGLAGRIAFSPIYRAVGVDPHRQSRGERLNRPQIPEQLQAIAASVQQACAKVARNCRAMPE